MPRRVLAAASLALGLLMLAGCPKGNEDYKSAKKAEYIQDWDTALEHYERALKSDPANTEYRLQATRVRFETALFHVRQGQKQRDKGELQLAVAEFEKAMAIDPSSAVAEQELRKTLEMLAGKQVNAGAAVPPAGDSSKESEKLLEKPPELRPVSREPINLKMTNDARIVFETIAKLAGLAVIFDPDFQPRRITTELTNVTLEQALDVVALESKTFWKPVTSNIIFVVPEQAQKRKDYEDYVVRTFYLSNTVQPQDLTEVVAGLRQIADLRRIQQVTSQNAIVVRDTPDKIALIEKILRDIDRAKPEVVVQVSVLEARTDRARDLGITPGSSAVLSFTPPNATSTTTGGTATTAASIALNKLQRLQAADYSITLPGASAMALLTDSTTKIIQNPEVRILDGQSAKLRIGDRVPIATGSFQAGLGGAVGGTAAAAFVNPLVNTQFQYQDVGVNIDITPRVHLNREVSLKISIEVSSVTGQVSIGGIQQPIISQRKIEHDVRLKDGEVSVLAGLVQRTDTKTNTGWPGFAHIPFFHYFFSGEHTDTAENEVLIVLTPRIVRLPELSAMNLESLSAGTESNIQVRKEESVAPPQAMPPSTAPAPGTAPGTQPPAGQTPAGQPPGANAQASRLRFEPQSITIHVGETATVSLVIEDARDLFSIPMLLGFNPAVITVEDVKHGGFLSGGTKDVALVQRIDKERGQAIISAARPPGAQGISGSGAIVMIVVRGVAMGASPLSVLQVNARDSQQKPIPLVSGEASIRVQ
jgi:general secretion pathway protein D